MKRTWFGAAVFMAAGMAMTHGADSPFAPQEAEPQPAAACSGVSAQPGRLATVLSSVPRYGSSYVLVVPERLADKIPSPDAARGADIEVGVHGEGEGAEAARAIGITRVRTYPLAESPFQPLQDIADGKLDAAVLWAPLAGLGLLELDLNEGQVALFTIDKPHAPPSSLRATAGKDPCSAAVLEALNGSGVLPAELLVSVDIRDILPRKVPAFDLGEAQRGAPVYEEYCARCHGPSAVADPKGLAPVDLRYSIRRFSFAGFNYIVLNGRPARSMPPLRGTVSDDEIALIYQFLKARSLKLLPDAHPPSGGK